MIGRSYLKIAGLGLLVFCLGLPMFGTLTAQTHTAFAEFGSTHT